jgi:hypothetical protein
MSPLTPGVTLKGTLQNVAGVNVGSAANPSKVRITLCGWGPTLPCVPGVANMDQPGPIYIRSTDGTFTTPLWGNDAISPAGTFYEVALLDDRDNLVQAGAYQFFQSDGTIDLSDAQQLMFGAPQLFGEAPRGAYPGTAYTLSYPLYSGQAGILFNGASFVDPTQYTVQGTSLTLNFETSATDSLYFLYPASIPGTGIPVAPFLTCAALTGGPTVFTLPSTPWAGKIIALFDGAGFIAPIYPDGTAQYTLSGTTLTTSFAIPAGDTLYAVYSAVGA